MALLNRGSSDRYPTEPAARLYKGKIRFQRKKSALGNNIAFVSALNGEISLLFLAEWWQVVRARRRAAMPQIPESCYERDERRIVLLLPAV